MSAGLIKHKHKTQYQIALCEPATALVQSFIETALVQLNGP